MMKKKNHQQQNIVNGAGQESNGWAYSMFWRRRRITNDNTNTAAPAAYSNNRQGVARGNGTDQK